MHEEERQAREDVPVEGGLLRGVIGLDLSLRSSGIVVVSAEPKYEVLVYSTAGYDLEEDKSSRAKIERMLDIARVVVDTARKFQVVAVGIEGYAFARHPGSTAATTLAELRGVVVSQLWLACTIEPKIVVASHARLVVLGKGAPGRGKDKKKAIGRILKGMGLTFPNDDVADAYVVARCVAQELQEQPRLFSQGGAHGKGQG